MVGSDLPIERLHGGFAVAYERYEEVFSDCTDPERAALRHDTAAHWYGSGPA